ncbi:MAG: Abi family protein [Butyrivibrio sp.]|nr:Abi family protein [Butyrivibrio sp.]
MNLKKPYTLDEQIKKIRDHGVVILDESFAKNVLQKISYYRLSGYMLQYRLSADSHEMEKGVCFEDIYKIYCFDEEIRSLLRQYIEKAEFFYKGLIGNKFAELKCHIQPYDQHYDINNYYDKTGITKTLTNFSKEKSYYKDSAIVKHHLNKYGDKMPIWVMMELMTCSSVSLFYHALYLSDKKDIAAQVGISVATLENHLHALSVIRNKCSHGVRLYNSSINPPVRFNKSFLRNNPSIKNDSLFAYVLMLVKRLPSDDERKQFLDSLDHIMRKYKEDIDWNLIGFPKNYMELMPIV